MKYDIENYPSVKKHLLSFGYDRLKQTGDKGARKKTNNKWFETQDSIGYWSDFFKQKIVYPNMASQFVSYYDIDNFLCNQKCFIVTGENLEFLNIYFNSKLNNFYFRFIGAKLGSEGMEMSKIFVEIIPILKITQEAQQPFINLVEKILAKKEKNENTELEENQIDKMIYKLYELTPEEIEFIESI